ncbi:MAG: ABC transporter ATP-binding protein [Candidatus Handelsmanbacteria bacterium]|nr:ABC transporter ATP-binding protein [Candidatus Handelsmanbacteria bacterium]
MIRIEQLRKVYQMGKVEVEALRGVDLRIARGEHVAILGPSGSGKSTLMHLIGCLDTPSTGRYWLDDKPVEGLSRNQLALVRNHQIGFVFQSFNLLAHATALGNVELPLIYQGMPRRLRRQRAASLLERVGLADRMEHRPNELSGGQRQRVALARALAAEPDLILADEPTGNLDTASGQEVVRLFEQLVGEGKTVIVVTHDLEIARRARRIIRLRDGRVEEDGPSPSGPEKN